jgi:hypothetical protein
MTPSAGLLSVLFLPDSVRKIAVILREALRRTVITPQRHGADRRISFGNGQGLSRQSQS